MAVLLYHHTGLDTIPPDCQLPIQTAHLVLSVGLLIGIIVSYIPQQLKIITTRSSDGLSPWYLMLGALSSISNLLNIAILQSPAIYCCTIVNLGQCLYNLLGLLQVVAQTAMFITVFILFYMYYPESKKWIYGERDDLQPSRDWKNSARASHIVSAFSLLSTIFSLLMILVFPVPSYPITTWTALLALIAVVASATQFFPQIMRTWKLKIVGALSVPAMMMQAPGSFLLCYTIAMSPGTNFSSWITYFVGGCLQSTLLLLCIYYQYSHRTEFIHIDQDDDSGDDEYDPSLNTSGE